MKVDYVQGENKLSYDDYVSETFKSFMASGRCSESEARAYFSEKETQEVIRADYNMFTGRNVGGVSPASTASCLYMLY